MLRRGAAWLISVTSLFVPPRRDQQQYPHSYASPQPTVAPPPRLAPIVCWWAPTRRIITPARLQNGYQRGRRVTRGNGRLPPRALSQTRQGRGEGGSVQGGPRLEPGLCGLVTCRPCSAAASLSSATAPTPVLRWQCAPSVCSKT